MHISRVLITNYRSIEQCDVQLRNGKNVLIGKNSSGKSNIIEAVNILFGERFPTRHDFLESDFYFSNKTNIRENRILIFARLEGEGINAEVLRSQRGLWLFPISGEPVKKSGDIFEIDHDIFCSIDDMKYPSIEWDCLNKRWIKGDSAEYSTLITKIIASPYFYFAFMCNADEDFREFSSEFRFIYKDSVDGRYYIITNMQYNFREAFVNSAIMPAFRDPYLQMKIVNYSWYGKLMKSTWELAVKDPEIARGMSDVIERLSQVGEPIFQVLSDDINNKINIGFNGAKVRFQFLSAHRQDMHKNVKVYLDDGIEDLLTRKGSGIQSAFIIGLFTYYCMFSHNTSILVVEEPEVFLHPHARRSISRRLDDFVKIKSEEGKFNQVIVTTHSNEILQTGGIETINLIRKGESGTKCKSFIFNDDFDQKEIRGILKTGVSEMLFADNVIICEGSEEFLLPRIADIISSSAGYLDDNNISIINANGKKYIATITRILDKLGIKWAAVVDFDFLDNTASNFLRKQIQQDLISNKIIDDMHQKIKSTMGADISKVMKGMRLDRMHAETQSLVQDSINRLKNNHNIWVLSNGSFEDYITEYGRDNLFDDYMKVDPSKLISVCLDTEMEVDKFFDIEEYSNFFQHYIFDE